jgi:hypothetical protein
MPKSRPILFNGEMVRAILADKKTQTRRPVKFIPALGEPDYLCPLYKDKPGDFRSMVGDLPRYCPFGDIGDMLWVKETWSIAASVRSTFESVYPDDTVDWEGPAPSHKPLDVVRVGEVSLTVSEPWVLGWRADYFGDDTYEYRGFKWHPSIHMPKWASRLTLKITGVDVQRINDITDEEAIAEGTRPHQDVTQYEGKFVNQFLREWDYIYASRGMGRKENPWVWVIKFETVEVYCQANIRKHIKDDFEGKQDLCFLKRLKWKS